MSARAEGHERIEELAAANALDGLDDTQSIELEERMGAHGPDCAECNRLFAEYGEAAAGLAAALPPVAPSRDAEERLLAAARLQPQVRPEGPQAGTASWNAKRRVRRPIPFRPAGWLVAASMAILLAAGGVAGYLLAPSPTVTGRQAAFARFVAQKGTQFVSLKGQGPGALTVAYRPGATGGWVSGASVPAPPGGKVYELWYLPPSAPSGQALQPAGLFVARDGAVLAQANVGARFTTVAVSVEPRGGSKQPTSQPVYVGRAS